ncbi:hypothetical protein [Bifidobacterium oedipodis]|uniref:Uncharacterized protein n=1 Tax=Bifidobacterium oedipodis TaxID=2675322 RepID=A0A7Y0EQQ3_9BIFI|nr:hypothetical protein [Bifidobacterium sp. DSM 109957]NMM94685.1 hypothetical protein [Bifidobacterium sp. DSM 109957]
MSEQNLVKQYQQIGASASIKKLVSDDDSIRYAMRMNFANAPVKSEDIQASQALLLKTSVAFIRYSAADSLDPQADPVIDAESVFFVKPTIANADAYKLVVELWPVIRYSILTQVSLLGKDMSRWLPVRISTSDIIQD